MEERIYIIDILHFSKTSDHLSILFVLFIYLFTYLLTYLFIFIQLQLSASFLNYIHGQTMVESYKLISDGVLRQKWNFSL